MTAKQKRPNWMIDGEYMAVPVDGLNLLSEHVEFDVLLGNATPYELLYLVRVKDADKLRDAFDYDPPQEKKEIPF